MKKASTILLYVLFPVDLIYTFPSTSDLFLFWITSYNLENTYINISPTFLISVDLSFSYCTCN